jgi:predicted O-methyltransferase YrrM
MFTTDKVGHGYLPTYLDLAARIGTRGRVLEVGMASGDGLRMFQALFPHGVIAGVDHNRNAGRPQGVIQIITDQAAGELPEEIEINTGEREWDLIVDDASHDNNLTRATWCLLWDLVRPGGWYVIEDWTHAGGLIREFGKELTDCFDEVAPLVADVEAITYRPGLIILRKKVS